MKQFNKNDVLVVDNKSDSYEPTQNVFSEDDLPFSIITFQTEEDSAENLFENSVFTGCGKFPAPEALMIDVPASAWNNLHLLSRIHADDESDYISILILSPKETR